jgi:hypothetical protein
MTAMCLRCGVRYDPTKPHLCGLLADETARALAERIDAFERRLQGLDGEARSRFNALERRVQELETAQAQGELDRRSPSADTTVKTSAVAPSHVRILLPPAPSPADKQQIVPEPASALDRKARHAAYMRQWRAWRAARRDVHA